MGQITVIVKKAVDRYHKINRAIDVTDDKYHRDLIQAGWLDLVEVEKPKQTKRKPEADAVEMKTEEA